MRLLLRSLALLFACHLSPARAADAIDPATTPVVGGPCEGCEAVFDGIPKTIRAQTILAPLDEPGERLVIRGQVRHWSGKPAAGIIIYAYHTDHTGIYPPPATPTGPAAARHGRLRGWARTDEEGRYEFDTIRPAGYPRTNIPSHVHMHIIEPGRCTYFIDDLVFDDDPRLTPERRRQLGRGRGGPGLTVPRRALRGRDQKGPWYVDRHIILGAGIRDYPE